jgi:hypothetical protein
MRERLQTSRLIQSIAVLANWADSDNLAIGIPPELCPLLSKGLDGDYWVERAWGKHSPGAMLSVLVEVRSRLLDFALRISETFPKELEPEELKKASKENSVAEAFQHSVFGNNATFGDNITILIGTGSIHDVHNAVGKNDFNSLAAALRSNSVSENDISELQVAIEGDSDSLDNKANKLGPNVRNWIGGMVAKAETSAWQLAIGTAGSLLAALIGAYYSFPK